MRGRRVLVLALVLCAGCRTGRNYEDTTGPRYAGGHATAAVAEGDGGSEAGMLRVVSFNVAYGEHIDRVIGLLTTEPALAGTDVLLLQEMDAGGTARIAKALGMQYRYYPAVWNRRIRRDFGNAVLSRWPIEEDGKLILPHKGLFARTHRAATAATIRVGSARVRVYSTHLATLFEVNEGQRREQLEMILEDARAYRSVIIGGDMNDGIVSRVAVREGYAWVNEDGPRTHLLGRFDHILARGLTVAEDASGVVGDVRGASDHKPVWAVALLPGATSEGR